MDLSGKLQTLPAYLNEDGAKYYFVLCREISGQVWQAGYERIMETGLNPVLFASHADSPDRVIDQLITKLRKAGIRNDPDHGIFTG